MSLDYRVTPLPAVWPGRATPAAERKRSPYKTIWTRALDLLEREVRKLDGEAVAIAVDVGPNELRNNGQLRADARPYSPAVLVSFATPSGRLQLASDRYLGWQNNVDVVGRALERLRLVDRDGLLQGRQYEGLRALPATTTPTLSAEAAARVVADVLGGAVSAAGILGDPRAAKSAVRLARAKTHPDANAGQRGAYDAVDAAAAVLTAYHGGAT